MMSLPLFPLFHWGIPLIGLATIVGVLVPLKGIFSTESGNDGEAALRDFFRASLTTFVLKVVQFFGAVVIGLAVLGGLMVAMGAHHPFALVLLIWAIVASAGVSVALATIVNAVGSHISDFDSRHADRIGQRLMALLVAVSVMDIWVWITLITEAMHRNWMNLGDVVAKHCDGAVHWSALCVQSDEFNHIIQHQLTMLCIVLGFGVLIHSLFIVLASRVMTTSLDRAAIELADRFPGLGVYDLRNPVGVASILAGLVHKTWTKTAIIQSLIVPAILGAIGIEAVTLSEGLRGLSPGSISMGLFVVSMGAFGAYIATFISGRRPMMNYVGALATVIATGLGLIWSHDVPNPFIRVYALGILASLIVFVMTTYDTEWRRWVVGRLEQFFVIYCFALGWLGLTFMVGGGQHHVLMGLNGLAVGTLVFFASSIPLLSSTFSESINDLNRHYRLLLSLPVDDKKPASKFKTDSAMALVAMGSGWVWFFIFMDWMPWVMTHIATPGIIARLIDTINGRLGDSVTVANWKSVLAHISFGEIDGLLGMSPANPDFIMGVFLAILFGLLIGILLLRFTRRSTMKLVADASTALNAQPAILEGEMLPDHSLALSTVSGIGLWSGLTIVVVTVIGLVVLACTMGWGGYAGACMGFVVMEGFVLVAHVAGVKRDLSNELEMGAVVVSLLTRFSIILICLIGGTLLEFGLGLMR